MVYFQYKLLSLLQCYPLEENERTTPTATKASAVVHVIRTAILPPTAAMANKKLKKSHTRARVCKYIHRIVDDADTHQRINAKACAYICCFIPT